MDICICCHSSLLPHLRQGRVYWFCPQCHQAMPGIKLDASYHLFKEQTKEIFKEIEAIPL